jgi:uncharacterized protein (TIGR00730 family)
MDELKVPEAWRVLRIQSELVDGIESLAKLGGAVTVFGGARTAENTTSYQQAKLFGQLVGKENVSVITGGGPGIMEGANRGCQSTVGRSVGLNISLPREQGPNPYLDVNLEFRYFFVRKFMFVKYAIGFVIFPGGFGTMDELFEALTLVQTGKVHPFPIVLVDKEYWSGLVAWMTDKMLSEGCISRNDLRLFTLVDSAEEAAQIILKHSKMLQASGDLI